MTVCSEDRAPPHGTGHRNANPATHLDGPVQAEGGCTLVMLVVETGPVALLPVAGREGTGRMGRREPQAARAVCLTSLSSRVRVELTILTVSTAVPAPTGRMPAGKQQETQVRARGNSGGHKCLRGRGPEPPSCRPALPPWVSGLRSGLGQLPCAGASPGRPVSGSWLSASVPVVPHGLAHGRG